MPIGFEINDYDSDADLSSTEDDNTQLPVNNSNRKNKKLKSKKKTEKKNPLKESKIVKDKAKKKIKNMESELNDLEFFDYLKEKTERKNDSDEENEDYDNFFTDEDLVDQFKELEKIQKLQSLQWQNKDVLNHREETPMEKRSNTINTGMSGMFLNRPNNSRTSFINATSRVDTNLPTRPVQNINRSYRNIGRMW